MRILDFPAALVGLLAFIAMVPVVVYFTTSAPGYQALPTEGKLLAGFSVPIVALLFLGSWLQTHR